MNQPINKQLNQAIIDEHSVAYTPHLILEYRNVN